MKKGKRIEMKWTFSNMKWAILEIGFQYSHLHKKEEKREIHYWYNNWEEGERVKIAHMKEEEGNKSGWINK